MCSGGKLKLCRSCTNSILLICYRYEQLYVGKNDDSNEHVIFADRASLNGLKETLTSLYRFRISSKYMKPETGTLQRQISFESMCCLLCSYLSWSLWASYRSS